MRPLESIKGLEQYQEEISLLKNYCFPKQTEFGFAEGRIPDVLIIGAARCGLAAMIKVTSINLHAVAVSLN